MERNKYEQIKLMDNIAEIFDLTSRTALISGGAGKMGQQFAAILSSAGCNVAITDINGDYCAEVAEKLSKNSRGKVIGFKADFYEEQEVVDVFAAARKELGLIDIFIHNVMPKPENYYAKLEDYKMETWNRVVGASLAGAFLGAREAAKDMKTKGAGSIVFTASTYGVVGPDQRIYKDCSAKNNIYGAKEALNQPACYSTSKGGLISLARHLASSWGKDGIRVNCLTPGGVFDGQEEAFHKAYNERTPLDRMAVWTDYNGAILFLASDASRYMTGANLVVDGGWTAW